MKPQREIAEHYMRLAKENLHQTGKVIPVVVLMSRTSHAIVPLPDVPRAMKPIATALVKQKAKEIDAHVAVWISEIWLKTTKPGEPIDESRPVSTYPDRMDGLVVTVYSKWDKPETILEAFRKLPDGKIQWEPFPQGDGIETQDNLWQGFF